MISTSVTSTIINNEWHVLMPDGSHWVYNTTMDAWRRKADLPKAPIKSVESLGSMLLKLGIVAKRKI